MQVDGLKYASRDPVFDVGISWLISAVSKRLFNPSVETFRGRSPTVRENPFIDYYDHRPRVMDLRR